MGEGGGGCLSVSEFTSTGLEERTQLVLAAWAVRVCVGGGLPATWGTQVSFSLRPACSQAQMVAA